MDKRGTPSHKYSVRIGGIYYCDGSCLDDGEQAKRTRMNPGREGLGGAQTAGVETADA